MNRFTLVPETPRGKIRLDDDFANLPDGMWIEQHGDESLIVGHCPACGRLAYFCATAATNSGDADYTCRLVITVELARPHTCPSPEDQPREAAA